MNNFIEIYFTFSFLVGYLYYIFWCKTYQTTAMKNGVWHKRARIHAIVVFLGTLLAPLSLFDMIYYKYKNKNGGNKL